MTSIEGQLKFANSCENLEESLDDEREKNFIRRSDLCDQMSTMADATLGCSVIKGAAAIVQSIGSGIQAYNTASAGPNVTMSGIDAFGPGDFNAPDLKEPYATALA